MKSPFPGMDPYLEQHWGDFHNNLISFAQGMLNERLPRQPAGQDPGTHRRRAAQRGSQLLSLCSGSGQRASDRWRTAVAGAAVATAATAVAGAAVATAIPW